MAGDEYIWKDDSNFISFKLRAKKYVERNVKENIVK